MVLTLAISIGNEVISAAEEEQLPQSELVALVFGASVVLGVLPITLDRARESLRGAMAHCFGWRAPPVGPAREAESDLLAFLQLFVRIAQRITASLCVQLVAANVVSTQPLRSVRIISLVGVTIFFVFLESAAGLGNPLLLRRADPSAP